ncbi:MAG: hypothetical protein LBE22_06985, partial [Azoarcus sp.]|nr:hypothetical protein [Azoarcus sp.]
MCRPYISDPCAQRHHFWMRNVEAHHARKVRTTSSRSGMKFVKTCFIYDKLPDQDDFILEMELFNKKIPNGKVSTTAELGKLVAE